MAEIIIMPKQGLQMTEGMITRWFFQEGDQICEGAELFEMETDKLTISIPAAASGTLLKIIRGAGETVPITQPIAIVGKQGDDLSGLLDNAPAECAEVQQEHEAAQTMQVVTASSVVVQGDKYASPRAKMTATSRGVDYSGVLGSGPDGLIIERDVLALTAAAATKATPLARKIAVLESVELQSVSGSGFHEKITANDVRAAALKRHLGAATRGDTLIPLTGMRRTVASRMKESLLEMAQANHRVTVDMTEAVRLREVLKKEDVKVSYNDIVLRCVAKALTEFPIMNSSWSNVGIVQKFYVNLGMAVALEDGLIVPVIKDADLLTLSETALCSANLAAKAKENKLTPDEFSDGTFTVSNLGMFDIDGFTAIINPPEAGILAVGKLAEQPVVFEHEIVIRPMMQLCLTYDHRIVDGAPAAKFLRRIKILLENPGLLI